MRIYFDIGEEPMDLELLPCAFDFQPHELCIDCSVFAKFKEGYREGTEKYLSHKAFLSTALWKQMSAFVKQRYNNRCANPECRTPNQDLVTHHLTYEYEWGCEPFCHLVCICQICHDKIHKFAT